MRMVDADIRSVDDIKSQFKTNKGKNVLICEFNKQGKKIHEYSGEIMDTYESLFLVKVAVNQFHINRTFAYNNFVTSEFTYEIM